MLILVPDPKPTPVLIAFSVVSATSMQRGFIFDVILNGNLRNDK